MAKDDKHGYNGSTSCFFAGTLSQILDAHGTFPVVDEALGKLTASKALIFHPTSMGQNLVDARPEIFKPLAEMQRANFVAPFPPTSFNCFASMYTGREINSKKAKTFKALSTPTLFDALSRVNKKSVVVTPKDCVLFKSLTDSDCDVVIAEHDVDAVNKAIGIIKGKEYDYVAVVGTAYETAMQLYGPFSKSAVKTAEKTIASFDLLLDAVSVYWQDQDVLVGFCPERGSHKVLLGGKSGTAAESDMNVTHYYYLKSASDAVIR